MKMGGPFRPVMLDPRFGPEELMKAVECDGERGAGIGVDSAVLEML
jgi:hypothetical protein